jgi:transcriptional regulator with XRE-family HTH domain
MLIVRKLRLQRGWTQEQLAEFAGLSARSVQRIERGCKPSLETCKALAAVFETEVSQFDIGEDSMRTIDGLAADEKEAIEHVKGVKEFYAHALIYLVISIASTTAAFAIGLDYVTISWIMTGFFGWGIGVAIHGLNAFEWINVFGPKWERKRIEKRLGRGL